MTNLLFFLGGKSDLA